MLAEAMLPVFAWGGWVPWGCRRPSRVLGGTVHGCSWLQAAIQGGCWSCSPETPQQGALSRGSNPCAPSIRALAQLCCPSCPSFLPTPQGLGWRCSLMGSCISSEPPRGMRAPTCVWLATPRAPLRGEPG